VRHCGDIDGDRRHLVDGWRGVYRWLRKLGVAQPYALVHEITPGADGTGHVHLHLATMWPYVPYDRMRAVFRRASDGYGERIHVSSRAKHDPKRAAGYLSKYASKGIDLNTFSPLLSARVLEAYYGQRKRGASHGFYRRSPHRCEHCSWPFRRVYGEELVWVDKEPRLLSQLRLPALE